MKKKIGVAFVAIIATATGLNFNQGKNNVNLSDLTLANIEALAEAESSYEFFQHTGCRAVLVDKRCIGKDGNIHLFAERP